MAVTYFGQCDASGTATANNGNWNDWGYNPDFIGFTNTTFVCPNTSGDQIIRRISAYAYDADAPGSSIRMGVYDADGALVVDCTTTAVISGTSAGWVDIGDGSTSNLGTLQGGTAYRIACAISGAAGSYPLLCWTTGTTGNSGVKGGTDYGAGLPATLPSADTTADRYLIFRVAVEPAASGQFARPSSDVADGGWTNESANNTNLYASIDETTANDADYIISGANPDNDTHTGALTGATGIPVAGTGTVNIRAGWL